MIKILKSKEKREIEFQLREQFGIENIPGIILKMGEERLFLFTGSLTEKQIQNLQKTIPLERLGVYFAKFVPGENAIKLSIEGTHALKDQIKKNIFSLNAKQTEEWMHGRDLDINMGKKRGFLIIKRKDDFLGSGKASELKIGNFIPKSRRLKAKEN